MTKPLNLPSVSELIKRYEAESLEERKVLDEFLRPKVEAIRIESPAGLEVLERFRDRFRGWELVLSHQVELIESGDPASYGWVFMNMYCLARAFSIFHHVLRDLVPDHDGESEH